MIHTQYSRLSNDELQVLVAVEEVSDLARELAQRLAAEDSGLRDTIAELREELSDVKSERDEARAAINAAEARTDRLAADLAEAARQLRRYQALHELKGTPESLEKARVNAQLAERFEKTLRSAAEDD